MSSLDMGNGSGMLGTTKGLGAATGVPLDSGLATPAGELADPFEEFNSVTLHHDGEDGGGVQDHEER